ncbi:hypothetical protein ADK65_30530 [Streptomyces sp. NRRL B-1140]|nr:hypothetical protein ADK65_30530 [Streptomyces sp. NRRL B-1140]
MLRSLPAAAYPVADESRGAKARSSSKGCRLWRPVVADLGEDAGCEQGAKPGEAEQDLAVGVLVEGGFGGCGEIIRGLAGRVQLFEQGPELVAEGVPLFVASRPLAPCGGRTKPLD